MQPWDDWTRADNSSRLQLEKAVLTIAVIAASWLIWLIYSSESGNVVPYKVDVPLLVTTAASPDADDEKKLPPAVDEV
jgi:hypothetical protein